MRFEAFPY
ncbi:hypothetical protein LINGRAPRIM_LOCUS3349 [Linum grandiflorum]